MINSIKDVTIVMNNNIFSLLTVMYTCLLLIAIPVLIIYLIIKLSRKNRHNNYQNQSPDYQQRLNKEHEKSIQQIHEQPLPMQDNKINRPQQLQQIQYYQQKDLLTPRELKFYANLRNIAQTYNLSIICKIRLADIVEPNPNLNRKAWYSAFGKITQKHIDFALTDPNDMKIICLIELDDTTHYKKDRIERDVFVNDIFNQVGIKLIRTWGELDEINSFVQCSLTKYRR